MFAVKRFLLFLFVLIETIIITGAKVIKKSKTLILLCFFISCRYGNSQPSRKNAFNFPYLFFFINFAEI